jgi:hypothetical protein
MRNTFYFQVAEMNANNRWLLRYSVDSSRRVDPRSTQTVLRP